MTSFFSLLISFTSERIVFTFLSFLNKFLRGTVISAGESTLLLLDKEVVEINDD